MRTILLPAVSAIYWALLQNGYSAFDMERDEQTVNHVRGARIKWTLDADFWRETAMYPQFAYPWNPRAGMLEEATLYINQRQGEWADWDGFRAKLLADTKVTCETSDPALWPWLERFPMMLKRVMDERVFQEYLRWETAWALEQTLREADVLRHLEAVMDALKGYYGLETDLRIVRSAIKCVYASDYFLKDNTLYAVTGLYNIKMIVYQLSRLVVVPAMQKNAEKLGLDEMDGPRAATLKDATSRRLTSALLDGEILRPVTHYLGMKD